ncbi:MAG: hypothetical protein JRH19_28185, partial [Deltaproteobacteria bacterium]|nr:hypothetical protein [Deltaproteobacteria bacterium]
ANDTLLVDLSSFSLAGDGSVSIPVPDGIPELAVGAGMTGRVFVALTATDLGSARVPNQFTVTHITESSTQAEDADNDTPITLQYTPDFTGKLITIPEASSTPMLIAGLAFLVAAGRKSFPPARGPRHRRRAARISAACSR